MRPHEVAIDRVAEKDSPTKSGSLVGRNAEELVELPGGEGAGQDDRTGSIDPGVHAGGRRVLIAQLENDRGFAGAHRQLDDGFGLIETVVLEGFGVGRNLGDPSEVAEI